MRVFSRFLSAGALGAMVLSVPAPGLGQEVPPEVLQYADLLVTNGVIYTADAKFSTAEGMAVRDGKVLAVGTADRIARMAGPETQRLDLQGRSVVPGFFDTHLHQVHVYGEGIPHQGRVRFDTLKEGLEEVRKLVEGVPAGEWAQASGPMDSDALYNVTRWELDKVSPNNPLVIIYAGELSVVNSKAWELAALSSDIPGILRNDKGEPTGQLRNWAHGALEQEILPWPEIGSVPSLVEIA